MILPNMRANIHQLHMKMRITAHELNDFHLSSLCKEKPKQSITATVPELDCFGAKAPRKDVKFASPCKDEKFSFAGIIGIILLTLSSPAHAVLDLQDMLQNLRSVLGPLITLLLIISYTAGIFMMFRGLSLLKSFGTASQNRPGEFIGPIVYIIVGTVLVYLPSATDVLTSTIFGAGTTPSVVDGGTINLNAQGSASAQLLSYAPVAIEGQWADLVDTIILYVQFIGFLAFIRGWFIVSHAGQPGAQPGSIPKGVTHIIGGLVAVNFLPIAEVLNNTVFGTSS